MYEFASLIILLTTPWLVGGLAFLLTKPNGLSQVGSEWVLFGVGGVSGLLGFGLLSIVATKFGLSLFQPSGVLLVIFLFLDVVLAFFAFHEAKNPIKNSASINHVKASRGFSVLLFLILITTVGVICQMAWVTPAAGWDTLDSWARIAGRFIESNQVIDVQPWAHARTHPSTTAVIAAWSAWSRDQTSSLGPVYFPWWLVWLSILFIVYGYTSVVTQSMLISLLAASVGATLPLLTNHTVLGGYAEIFLAATAVGSAALLSLGQLMKNWRFIAAGLIFSFTTGFYKNTGVIFSACIIVGWLLSHLMTLGYGRKILVGLILAGIGVFGMLLLWDGFAGTMFKFGTRKLVVQPENLWLIPRNELYILFNNGSFNILPLFLLFPITLLLQPRAVFTDKNTAGATLTPWMVSLSVLAFLAGVQLTEYGFLYASPGGDTGNSRLTLAAIVCLILSIGWLVKFATEPVAENGVAECVS